jgi:recombination protein RecT
MSNNQPQEKPQEQQAPAQQTDNAPDGKLQPAEQPAKNATAKTGKTNLPAKLIPLKEALLAPKKAFIAAGGTEVEFNRELNFAAQILESNDYLRSVAMQNPESLITAIKNVGLTKLSLNPELKLGYLVPRKNKGVNAVYFTSSYMGKREILMRSGCVRWIEANLVYAGDEFEVMKGTTTYINHKPDPWGSRSQENIKGGYWMAILNNGEKVCDTMPMQRILEVKARSESVKAGKESPWDTDFVEMARKTILNAAYSQLPKTDISDAVLRVMEVESTYDDEEFDDWKKQQEESKDRFQQDGKPTFTDYEEVKQ